jgi:hypothetical protein
MARNTDKNAYWYVGIPRHSPTYQRLLADAKDKGVSVPTLIAMRIDDIYKGIAGVASEESLSEMTASEEVEEVPPSAETKSDQEEANALAALEAWG